MTTLRKSEQDENHFGMQEENKGVKIAVSISFPTDTEPTERTLLVNQCFGLGLNVQMKFTVYENVEIDLRPTDVVYVCGDSGSGKSLLIHTLGQKISQTPFFGKIADLNTISPRPSDILIEGAGSTFESSLENLCLAGLSDAFLMIRRVSELSDGQVYRYKLALLINSDARVWIADEFCSILDRTTAKIVAFCLQKQARRLRKTLIVATTHEDLYDDLNPTVFIRKGFGSRCSIDYRNASVANSQCSLLKVIRFREGTRQDYQQLHQFHYRAELPSNTTRIFSLEHSGELVGCIAYGTPPLSSAGRRTFMGYRVPSEQVNSDFLNISRVVVHPKFRSIGLGAMLVRNSLPLVSKKYVETTAVMAKYNPFFEKAGMQRVAYDSESAGEYEKQIKALEELGVSLSSLSEIDSMKDEQYFKVCDFLAKSDNYHTIISQYGHDARVDKTKLLNDLVANRSFVKNSISKISILSQEKAYFIWKNPGVA